MSQNTVSQLPAETVKLITSTQIVTSVGTAVKELLENSIDAGAKIIQVRLENYGLDLIEVKDDGSGVSYDNVQKMFLPGYTSKITQFEDLDKLYSYGFRGEALAAICKIAKVSITTKTNLDTLAMTYEIDSSGTPLSSKPSHLNNGTIVVVSNLFSNLPVRRLFISSKKKMSEELKKAEQIVQSLSLIHPELGVSLIHNKCPIWKKNAVKGIKQSFMQVVGLKTVSKMEHLNKSSNKVILDLIVPKKKMDNIDNTFTNSPHGVYVYVNKRPVVCKNLSQPVQEHIFNHYSNLNISQKYAISLISIQMSPHEMDINLEPNKTRILLKNEIEVIKLIDETLASYYGHRDFTCTKIKEALLDDNTADEHPIEQQAKRPRLEAETKGAAIGEKRSKEFIEKNSDWHLEIINEDCTVGSKLTTEHLFEGLDSECTIQASSHPQSLCSQINTNNCVLTTEEVSELNNFLNENNYKLVTSTSTKNGETRMSDRNDIQSKSAQKPILKEWPSRPKVTIESGLNMLNVESSLNEEENKAVEEIAAEIERGAEKWSSEMLKAIQADDKESGQGKDEQLLEDEVQGFDLSVQSVSSQMGKKEMKAFTKFARIMRPKIVEEFPNIMFTQVAGILADRWKSLTPEEVKHYEKMAEVVDLNRKIHQEAKAKEAISSKPRNKPKSSPSHKTANVKAMIEQMKKKSKLNRPPRKEIPFLVSMSEVKRFGNELLQENAEDFRIIGKLHPSGNWLYRKGKEIGHVRYQGLQELIIYQKMLSSFSVPRKSLEKTILINEESLGTILWNILISLELEWTSSKYVITSEVVTKNGFRVEINKNGDVITEGNITEVALSIPHYGISELKDALRMYQKNGEFGGLASWRPSSVCNYITNEAVRLAHKFSQPPDREEIEDSMNTYNLCFRHLPPVCLHSREIFPSIHHIQDDICNLTI